MSDITANDNLAQALEHVSQARRHTSHHNDIWHLRAFWQAIKPQLQQQLMAGQYQLSPTQACRITDQGLLYLWSAVDAVVLRAIAQVISPIVNRSITRCCYHLKGRGGLKAALQQVNLATPHHRFVVRSDVANFYDSMQKDIVMRVCRPVIQDRRVLNLIGQTIERVDVIDGIHILNQRGIPKGCPLSPLIGGLMLKALGERLPKRLFFAIYMDDWVILTHTRGALRRAVKIMHAVMAEMGFGLAPDKTYIGKISNGFDFLGFRFLGKGLSGLATKTILNFQKKLQRLYEQGASKQRIAQYLKRWQGWVAGAGTSS